MATLREIKRRIGSIKSTEKITRAMKMVASVKFRKANQAVLASRPYSKGIDRMLRLLLPSIENYESELIKGRDIVKKVALVVVSGDRGLAGSFNTNLLKAAQNLINTDLKKYHDEHDLTIITIGRKAYDYFFKRGYDIYASHNGIFDSFNFNTAKAVVEEILTGYYEKKFDQVIVIYNEFKNVVQSKIIHEQFLPLERLETVKDEEKRKAVTNYIYEPGQKEIIDYLLPKQLNTHIWQILLESYASEQAARMTAMDSATSNANELLGSLNLLYNRERQAAITKELLEVISGANALKEG